LASGLLLSLPSARERAISKRGETNMATKKAAKPVKKGKKLGSVKPLSSQRTLQSKMQLLKSPINVI